MNITILAFGIARDIVGGSTLTVVLESPVTVASVKAHLTQQYPEFAELASLRVAVNTEYAEDSHVLEAKDEVVLIPPVSGG